LSSASLAWATACQPVDEQRRLAHARAHHGRDIKLLTRTGLDWSHRYRRTIEALGLV
jgi:hypothetical protein